MSITDYLDVWSNAACCGYAIRAMQEAGIPHEQIQRVLDKLESAFGELTVKEAATIWYDY